MSAIFSSGLKTNKNIFDQNLNISSSKYKIPVDEETIGKIIIIIFMFAWKKILIDEA
mgnify:CR=1 FL=1